MVSRDNELTFADVVEAADRLSSEEQEQLIEIVRRRLAEDGRARLIERVREAREELASGKCKPMTVEQFMEKARSYDES